MNLIPLALSFCPPSGVDRPLTHTDGTRPGPPACGPHCPEGCARCALTSALRELGAGRVVVLPPGKYPTKIVSVGRAR